MTCCYCASVVAFCSSEVIWGVLFLTKLPCYNFSARLNVPLWEYVHCMFYEVFSSFERHMLNIEFLKLSLLTIFSHICQRGNPSRAGSRVSLSIVRLTQSLQTLSGRGYEWKATNSVLANFPTRVRQSKEMRNHHLEERDGRCYIKQRNTTTTTKPKNSYANPLSRKPYLNIKKDNR